MSAQDCFPLLSLEAFGACAFYRSERVLSFFLKKNYNLHFHFHLFPIFPLESAGQPLRTCTVAGPQQRRHNPYRH